MKLSGKNPKNISTKYDINKLDLIINNPHLHNIFQSNHKVILTLSIEDIKVLCKYHGEFNDSDYESKSKLKAKIKEFKIYHDNISEN